MRIVSYLERLADLLRPQYGQSGSSSSPEYRTQDRLPPGTDSVAIRWYSTKWAYAAAIFLVLGISAGWASTFGYLTIDSWNYLHLAQSIRDGQGCSVRGAYFATFPCGYPLVIALTAPSTEIGALIVSSKVTNLILLFVGFFFLMKTFRNVLVPVLIVVNPFTIELYQYTWSENLFLLAFCASIYAISRIAHNGSSRWYAVLLACTLIVGCSSRYFFAPFSVVIFAAAWISYGRTTAIRALPAFVAAAIFFLGYQKFNVVATGFPTGTPRIPAPETFVFLLFRFIRQVGKEFILTGALLLILLWGLKRTRGWASASGSRARVDAQPCRLLALSGAGYLLLAFYLRTLTQYDIYSPRTVSYGLVFVIAALVGLVTRTRTNYYPAIPVIIYGAFCLLTAQAEFITTLAGNIVHHRYVSPVDALERYRNSGTNADIIVSLRIPDVGPTMDAFPQLYYPKRASIIEVEAAPYSVPDTVSNLKKKIENARRQSCVFDFTPFRNRHDLERFVDGSFPVGFSFRSFPHGPQVDQRGTLDPSMRSLLLAKFQPGRYVACSF
ncbi:hypothetical protein [Paraburkholderia sp. MM5482-R1]|uniref:hypothetical protein n=1 Tax=unclassified Paraburkholderia TaxID=2615204 RepID=UPI003D20A099